MVPFEKVLEIVNSPDGESPKGRRDRAALALLFGGGLRRGEVVRLRIGDLRVSSSGTPFVRLRSTKAKRDADQALPDWAAEIVGNLAAERRREGAAEGDYLLISYTGTGGTTPTNRPLSDNGLYRLFREYCLRAGAGAFLTPHSARATAITKLLTDGYSHREVQEFSRHSSVTMVEVYDKRRLTIDDNPGKKLRF